MIFVERGLPFLIVIGVIVGLSACVNSKEAEIIDNVLKPSELPHNIDFDGNLNNYADLFLSDFADSVTYVALETTEESVLPEFSNVVPVEDGYLIPTRKGPLYYFDSSGKYVRKIGSFGRGPGEYLMSMFSQYCWESDLVYIPDIMQNRIFLYSLDGIWLSSINFEERISGCHVFPNGNVLLAIPYDTINENSWTFRIIDSTGELVSQTSDDLFKPPKWGGMPIVQFVICNDSTVLLPSDYRDSIYQISQNGEIEIFGILNLGDHKMPQSVVHNREKHIELAQNFYTTPSFTIFPKIILASIGRGGKSYYGTYNSVNKVYALIRNVDQNSYGIINDIDNGPSFKRGILTSSYFNKSYQLIQPITLFEMLEIQNIDKDIKSFPLRLREIVKSLNEDDNAIIMITHIKNGES